MGGTPYLIAPLDMIITTISNQIAIPSFSLSCSFEFRVRVGKKCVPLSLRVLSTPQKNQMNKNILLGVLGLGLKLADYVTHWPKGIFFP
jgi:hypothetical protein